MQARKRWANLENMLIFGNVKTFRTNQSTHISRASCHDPALTLRRFAEEYRIEILNVAGSRESKEPGIYQWVMQVLDDALFWAESHPGAIGGPAEG